MKQTFFSFSNLDSHLTRTKLNLVILLLCSPQPRHIPSNHRFTIYCCYIYYSLLLYFCQLFSQPKLPNIKKKSVCWVLVAFPSVCSKGTLRLTALSCKDHGEGSRQAWPPQRPAWPPQRPAWPSPPRPWQPPGLQADLSRARCPLGGKAGVPSSLGLGQGSPSAT